MPRRNLNITANDERIDRMTREMANPLEAWLRSAAAIFAADEARKVRAHRARRRKLSKAAAPGQAQLEKELLRILVTFGVRSVDNAGSAMAARLDGDWVVTPSLIQMITRQKQVKIQQLVGNTKRRVRDQVRKIMLDANRERPRPSIAEIARRIRVQVVELPPLAGAVQPEMIARANRAAAIAETESTQNENTGIAEGMIAADVDEIEWLAHTDGKSGDRHHERMNGKRITIAAMRGSDRSKWFRMPSGARLRYPADPSGPISETAR